MVSHVIKVIGLKIPSVLTQTQVINQLIDTASQTIWITDVMFVAPTAVTFGNIVRYGQGGSSHLGHEYKLFISG